MEDAEAEPDGSREGKAETPEQPAGDGREAEEEPGRLVSNAGSLTVKLSPASTAALAVGEYRNIKATVSNAKGTVTYRWEVSTNNGKTWKDAGVTTATLKAKMTESNYLKVSRYQYRCNVTDSRGTVCSTPVKIKALITVIAPATVKGGLDTKVKMTATVTTSLTGTPAYQWQISTDGGTSWSNTNLTGNKTTTLTLKATEERYTYLFRCMVTIDGKKMYSDKVSLEKPYTVSVSPSSSTVAIGKTGKFTATSKGSTGKVTYQWQASDDGGTTWKNTTISGYNTATLSVAVKYGRYGQMFRCVVSAGNGKVASGAVWLNPVNHNYYNYKDNGKGQWIVAKYKKDDASIVIPAGYAGRKVVGISANVFKGKANLQTVVIPPSVTSIGDSAFEDCTKLTTVTLSDYVKTIGKKAFKNCSKLAVMKIANK